MDYLPINLKIQDTDCLVVGGGSIALRKSKQLLKAGATLTLVAPEFHLDIKELALKNQVKLIVAKYHSDHLNNRLLVIAATDDPNINHLIFKDAKDKKILINTVDQPNLCQFIMPAVIDRTPLTIAISSGGTAPVFARMLREKFEWFLPSNIGQLLLQLNSKRDLVKKKYSRVSERRHFWEKYFERILNWSTRNNVNNPIPKTLDINTAINLLTIDKLNSHKQNNSMTLSNQLTIFSIQTNCFDLDDLTINQIKALQKADTVYLTNKHLQLLENIIRRDSEIKILNNHMMPSEKEKVRETQLQSNEISSIVIIESS